MRRKLHTYMETNVKNRPWEVGHLWNLHESGPEEDSSCPTCEGRGVFVVPADNGVMIDSKIFPCFACSAFGYRSDDLASIRYVEAIRAAQTILDSGLIIVKTSEGRLNFHKDMQTAPMTLRAVLKKLNFESAIFNDLVKTDSVAYQKLEKNLFQEDREQINA